MDGHELMVWAIGGSLLADYRMSDTRYYFQFLQLAGHYLVWFAALSSALLDLDTGNGFALPNGSVAGSADLIVKSEAVRPPMKGEIVTSRVSVVSVSAAPPVATCTP